MTEVQFFDPTEKAERKPNAFAEMPHWEACPVGKAFPVPLDMVRSDKALRAYASAFGKRHGRRFRVTKHPGAYEIARTE